MQILLLFKNMAASLISLTAPAPHIEPTVEMIKSSIIFQILFENQQLFPHLSYRETDTLWQTSKSCRAHVKNYQTRMVKDFNSEKNSAKRPLLNQQDRSLLLSSTDKSEIYIPLSSISFDTSGNYACGYSCLVQAPKEDYAVGTCNFYRFHYPSLVIQEKKVFDDYKLIYAQATATRSLTFVIIYDYKTNKLYGFGRTWNHTTPYIDLTGHENIDTKTDGDAIVCTTKKRISHFHQPVELLYKFIVLNNNGRTEIIPSYNLHQKF